MIASAYDLVFACVGVGFTLLGVSFYVHHKRNPPKW